MGRDDLLVEVLSRARTRGATAADGYLAEERHFSASVRLGEVETVTHARDQRLSLRVFVGRASAAASTSDLSRESLDRVVDEATSLARVTAEDPCAGLPDPAQLIGALPALDLDDDARTTSTRRPRSGLRATRRRPLWPATRASPIPRGRSTAIAAPATPTRPRTGSPAPMPPRASASAWHRWPARTARCSVTTGTPPRASGHAWRIRRRWGERRRPVPCDAWAPARSRRRRSRSSSIPRTRRASCASSPGRPAVPASIGAPPSSSIAWEPRSPCPA